jgi:hypothetical protein
MNNFIAWFERNRKPIGYTIGGMNVVSGLGQMADGQFWPGIVWLILGIALVFDAHQFK